MIQRIQTLYLLIVAILMALTLFLPLAWFASDAGEFTLRAFGLETAAGEVAQPTSYLGILLVLACLLPLVISGVHGNFSDGLDALWFQFEKTHAQFWFREDREVHTLKAGYSGEMLAGELCLHGERYPCRTGVQVLHDEDGRVVLKLFLVFPETPCTRYMKFVFHGEDGEWLLLRLNERPSVARAAEMFTSLVTGGRTAEELVPPGLQKLPLFDRMRDLLRPKASGKWNRQAVPERTPQQPEEELSGCDES